MRKYQRWSNNYRNFNFKKFVMWVNLLAHLPRLKHFQDKSILLRANSSLERAWTWHWHPFALLWPIRHSFSIFVIQNLIETTHSYDINMVMKSILFLDHLKLRFFLQLIQKTLSICWCCLFFLFFWLQQ